MAMAIGQRVRAACEAIGRDPDDMVFSAAQVLCCGESHEEQERRAGAIGRGLDDDLRTMLAATRGLGMTAVVETHSDCDLERALATDARVIGVNARDLETLRVDPVAARADESLRASAS